MWEKLPEENKNSYKKLILAFASLTELFAQKAEDDDKLPAPIINSKYQETVFQKSFSASAEDIGNTSYDAALKIEYEGQEYKFLVGIKTFGIGAGDQKVAQFKANLNDWLPLISKINDNAKDSRGNQKSLEEINAENESLYLEMAKEVAAIRNKRIKSSEANLKGFKVSPDDEPGTIESIYHVLMPSKKGDEPKIFVGETSYNKIDIDKINITGCTSRQNPANFTFSDGHHKYKYTSADCQLYMSFDNDNIVKDEWKVIYAKNPYALFEQLAAQIYGIEKEKQQEAKKVVEKAAEKVQKPILQSYSWSLLNKDGEIEKYSGLNSFYGLGSKNPKGRMNKIASLEKDFKGSVPNDVLTSITAKLWAFASQNNSSEEREKIREEIRLMAVELGNNDFLDVLLKIMYRPANEVYIPIPNAMLFHTVHPSFFVANIKDYIHEDGKLYSEENSSREFNLIFEPSGEILRSYITQQFGKAIESVEKQTYLGEWLLKGVFQLDDYEPLTAKKLAEIGINGIRLYKTDNLNNVHLEFIWIDEQNLPKDFCMRK